MVRAVGVIAALGLLLAGGTAQAAGWTPIETIATGTGIDTPAVAVAPSGAATVTWLDGSNAVQAADRAPGGTWTPTGTLSAANVDEHVVARGSGGATVAAWVRGGLVELAYRPPGGAFGAVETLADSGAGAQLPRLVVTPLGTAYLVWQRTADTSYAWSARAATAAPTATAVLADHATTDPPALGIDAAGDVTAVVHVAVATNHALLASTALPDAALLPAVGFSGSSFSPNLTAPALAVRADGAAAIAATTGPGIAVSWLRPGPAAGFAALPSGAPTAPPTIALLPDGQVLIASATNGEVRWRTKAPADPVYAPESAVLGATALATPRLVSDGTGNAILAWVQNDGVHLSLRPPGGTFAPAARVSTGDAFESQPVLASDEVGDTLLVWSAQLPQPGGGTLNAIQARAYDAAPPRLDAVTVPASGVAGQAVSTSATATDLFSAVTTTWSFGDGASATGPTASHAYAAPGTYTVTVSATDAAGNGPVQEQRTIVVAAPPAPPAAPPPPAPAGPAACAITRSGSKGPDRLVGTTSGDRLTGKAGNDTLRGLAGDDCLDGGPGDDTLHGGKGDNRLTGGPGEDTLTGGPGLDAYNAGPGDDTIQARDGTPETIRCGTGTDTARLDTNDTALGCETTRRR